jgi:hypothetical protein
MKHHPESPHIAFRMFPAPRIGQVFRRQIRQAAGASGHPFPPRWGSDAQIAQQPGPAYLQEVLRFDVVMDDRTAAVWLG